MLLDPLLLVRAANATFKTAAESQTILQCRDIEHCRTLQSIVYSCLSTVFLCTWTALHLDVPKEPHRPTPLRRVWYMLGALLAPEVVFGFACDDWTDGSEMLREIMEHSPNSGYTATHAQFARMGGFRLKYPDGEMEIMRDKKFFDYIQDGTIDLPKVSEAEILGRCKGDPISKSITIVQTAWFVIQCIHRRSQHLPLTELEVTTLGHTLINVFIYWFWWYKPLSVSFPIDVPSKKPRPDKKYLTIEQRDDKTGSNQSSSDPSGVVASFLKQDTGDQEGERNNALNDVLSFMSRGDETGQTPQTTSQLNELTTKSPPTSDNDRGNASESHNLKSSDDKDIADPNPKSKVDVEAVKVLAPQLSLHSRLGVLLYTVGDSEMLSLSGRIVLSTTFFFIGGAFGAMHCLAWNSEFPTRAEQLLWQVSSLIVAIPGGLAMAFLVSGWDVGYELFLTQLMRLLHGQHFILTLINDSQLTPMERKQLEKEYGNVHC